MVIHKYDKRKNNDTSSARAKLAEYVRKGKELKQKADEEPEEEQEEDELVFTLEDLKELEEPEEVEKPKKIKEAKEEKKEEKKDDYKDKYEALQKELEVVKKQKPMLVEKSHRQIESELIRSKLMASFQAPHK